MYCTSPLEQFQIFAIFPTYKPLLTNITIFTILEFSGLLLIIKLITQTIHLTPKRTQATLEILYTLIQEMVKTILGTEGVRFFPLIFLIFIFLMVSNLIGMVPYAFTVASHIFITFSLSFSIFLGITLTGFIKHKLKFMGLFLPIGTPSLLAPFFVLLEVISYLMRAVSLAIRLSSNLIAGHTLLKIIAGFVWILLHLGSIGLMLTSLPILIIIAVTLLELAIAVVQAYVFTTLTCLYLNDALALH